MLAQTTVIYTSYGVVLYLKGEYALQNAFPSSPRNLVLIVALAVFISESISMAIVLALLPVFPSRLTETLLDSESWSNAGFRALPSALDDIASFS